ncbi:hypothetical protein J6590_107894, partial [Homalodisca vitripennis]
ICSGAVCVPPHRSAYHYPPSARAIPATVPSSLTVSPYGGCTALLRRSAVRLLTMQSQHLRVLGS